MKKDANITPALSGTPPSLPSLQLRLLFLVAAMTLLLSARSTTFAGSATWKSSPATGDWNTASNWSPATVPNGPSDTATFATSNITGISLSAPTEVNGILFNSGASAFSVTVSNQDLTISGAGITNNSGTEQTFVAKGTALATGSSITFLNGANAGSTTLIANGGLRTSMGGLIQFGGNSDGGTAGVTLLGKGSLDIRTHDSNAVSIGSLEGDGNVFLGSKELLVGTKVNLENATTGSDSTLSYGKSLMLGGIPILAFSFDNVTSSNVPDDSGSGNIYTSKAIDVNGLFTPTTDASFTGSGKALHFDGTRLQRIEVGGSALTVQAFTIMADVRLSNPVSFTDPANKRFEISEKAGSYWANIRMDQGVVNPGPPYLLRVGGFFDGTGDESFLRATGLTPGTWANVALVFDPVAHTMSSYINGVLDYTKPRLGTLDTSISHNGIDEKLVVGAKHKLGGAGEVLEALFDGQMDNYRLYNVALTPQEIASVAGTPVLPPTSTNLKSTFLGVIRGSNGGSLTKAVTGTLSLGNINSTYTGATTINGGKLLISTGGSPGTGSGPMLVNEGVLGGYGGIAGPGRVGTGSGPGALLSPGARFVGELTFKSAVTFNSDATYKLKVNRLTGKSDRVIADGVIINAGAQFVFADRGTGTLSPGKTFLIILNTSSSPIDGTFTNLPDGSSFTNDGHTYKVNYQGGDGNDLTLTVVP